MADAPRPGRRLCLCGLTRRWTAAASLPIAAVATERQQRPRQQRAGNAAAPPRSAAAAAPRSAAAAAPRSAGAAAAAAAEHKGPLPACPHCRAPFAPRECHRVYGVTADCAICLGTEAECVVALPCHHVLCGGCFLAMPRVGPQPALLGPGSHATAEAKEAAAEAAAAPAPAPRSAAAAAPRSQAARADRCMAPAARSTVGARPSWLVVWVQLWLRLRRTLRLLCAISF